MRTYNDLPAEVKLIAEIGTNHGGDFALAKSMILEAAAAGVWAVKFQKRDPKSLKPELYNKPYRGLHSYGATYGEHREALEFRIEWHNDLKEMAHNLGIKYGCSVFDMKSAKEIASIEPDYIKIGSGQNRWEKLIKYLDERVQCPIHISTGMEKYPFDIWLQFIKHIPVDYVCTSSYPTEPRDLKLNLFNNAHQFKGFSCHSPFTMWGLLAATLGVEYIEYHMTLPSITTPKGRDHAISLIPYSFKVLKSEIEQMHLALKNKPSMLPCEEYTKENYNWDKIIKGENNG